jgi:hypothetical protein
MRMDRGSNDIAIPVRCFFSIIDVDIPAIKF